MGRRVAHANWRRETQACYEKTRHKAYHERARHAVLSAPTYWASRLKKKKHQCWQKHSPARALEHFNPHEAKFSMIWRTSTLSFLSNWRTLIIQPRKKFRLGLLIIVFERSIGKTNELPHILLVPGRRTGISFINAVCMSFSFLQMAYFRWICAGVDQCQLSESDSCHKTDHFR